MINSEWLTVGEVASELGVTAGRVRQVIVEKRILGKKFGGAWAINSAEVERFKSLERSPGNPNLKKQV